MALITECGSNPDVFELAATIKVGTAAAVGTEGWVYQDAVDGAVSRSGIKRWWFP